MDSFDSYPELAHFVATVAAGSPVDHFVIHARKCLLRGLSPHQNRTVPPLRYEWVWALKRDYPHLHFSLNGGVQTLEEAAAALRLGGDDSGSLGGGGGGSGGGGGGILGVMVGRAAYNAPWDTLADADRAIFGAAANPAPSRRAVLRRYAEYADAMVGRWEVKPDGHASPSVRTLFKPLLGMFHKVPRGKRWRAAVSFIRAWERWSATATPPGRQTLCRSSWALLPHCPFPLGLTPRRPPACPPPAAGGHRAEERDERVRGAGRDAGGAGPSAAGRAALQHGGAGGRAGALCPGAAAAPAAAGRGRSRLSAPRPPAGSRPLSPLLPVFEVCTLIYTG